MMEYKVLSQESQQKILSAHVPSFRIEKLIKGTQILDCEVTYLLPFLIDLNVPELIAMVKRVLVSDKIHYMMRPENWIIIAYYCRDERLLWNDIRVKTMERMWKGLVKFGMKNKILYRFMQQVKEKPPKNQSPISKALRDRTVLLDWFLCIWDHVHVNTLYLASPETKGGAVSPSVCNLPTDQEADFEFQIGKESLVCNKQELMNQSPVLKEALEADPTCSRLVCFEGYSVEAVRRFLSNIRGKRTCSIDIYSPEYIKLLLMLDAKRLLEIEYNNVMASLSCSGKDWDVWCKLAQSCRLFPCQKWAEARVHCMKQVWRILLYSNGHLEAERSRYLDFQKGAVALASLKDTMFYPILFDDVLLRDLIMLAWDDLQGNTGRKRKRT